MEDWQMKLRRMAVTLNRKEKFREDPIDAIIRITLRATYQPKHGEVVAVVVRSSHGPPYVTRTVQEGLIVYADPGGNENALEGNFVGVRFIEINWGAS